jgi:exodeoxyribonuclease V alpha subunit
VIPSLEALRAAGHVSALDFHFARRVGQLAGEERPQVLLAAALVSRYVGAGHVCLDLAKAAASARLGQLPEGVEGGEPAGAGSADAWPWPELSEWLEMLRSSPLVSDGGEPTPLVLDREGRLYLQRYWEHQRELASAIRSRLGAAACQLDAGAARRSLERLFPRGPDLGETPDWQRVAASVALQRQFCVISGGPGTGKTRAVVKLLALLIEYELAAGRRAPRAILVAPTGKAAARLSESVRRELAELDCQPEVERAIPTQASTIHRCLGSFGGSSTRFRRDAEHPLATDLVLVDEASMVDLALMARLVAAVPAGARLILLGDADQLASVEAGAVLGDICDSGGVAGYSRQLADALLEQTDERVPVAPEEECRGESGLRDCIVRLTRSYRYRAGSGISALAEAINAGDAERALSVLEDPACDDVERIDPDPKGGLGEALQRATLEGFGRYLRAPGPAEQLELIGHFRVLCARRRGPGGVEWLNREIEAALLRAGLLQGGGEEYAGRLVMVTRNDYDLGLFNGDVGVVSGAGGGQGRGAEAGESPPLLACFAGEAGRLRSLAPSRLPRHETVFAMSVHKSQGSEFDRVTLVLPDGVRSWVSRELLYTAVTRARRHVTMCARPEVIHEAVSRRIQRASGLRQALWEVAEGG